MSILKNTKKRYAAWAKKQEPALCCPVNYEKKYLEVIPEEVIKKDYWCWDPSRYVKKWETVLDLWSGWWKICFIASQIVWKEWRVIWVDMTDDMLDLAKRNQAIVAQKIWYDNIEFKHWYIEDLKTDLDKVDDILSKNPISNATSYKELNEKIEELKSSNPMIEDHSIDVIVSNCVLNLVSDEQKTKLFQEMFRVLKVWWRIAISDIVSDEDSPELLKNNHDLWSWCISWALQEKQFIEMLEVMWFYWITIDKFQDKPWHTVDWIEYRSVNIIAYKWIEWPSVEKNQAIIYKWPWKHVGDDDWHVFERWERMAVCEKTFDIMNKAPYKDSIIPINPSVKIDKEIVFDRCRSEIRTPAETKKGVKKTTTYNLNNNWWSCC